MDELRERLKAWMVDWQNEIDKGMHHPADQAWYRDVVERLRVILSSPAPAPTDLREQVKHIIATMDSDEANRAKSWDQLCDDATDYILSLVADSRPKEENKL